jgi:hypothetical protein
MLPQGVPGTLYKYQLNANVQSQWYLVDYSTNGLQITEGVVIGKKIYFVIDNFGILEYNDSIFTLFPTQGVFIGIGQGTSIFSMNNGQTWSVVPIVGDYAGIAFGNGTFVAVGTFSDTTYSTDNGQTWYVVNLSGSVNYSGVIFENGTFFAVGASISAYSTDNGQTWSVGSLSGIYYSVAFGNGTFVVLGFYQSVYSTDNGQTWLVCSLSGIYYDVTFGNGTFVAISSNQTAYSTDNGQTWSVVPISGDYYDLTVGNGTFVAVGDNISAYSTDNGQTWSVVPISGTYTSLTFGNGTFVAVGYNGSTSVSAYSTDNGQTWSGSGVPLSNFYFADLTTNSSTFTKIPGDGFKNLIAVGNYIYCSTSNVAVQIDTSQDLSTAAAYNFPAPLPDNQYVFANGPRYVYMFAQGDNSAKNIVEFDPYGPDTTFKASILVDYESLPPGVPKPDKALLGLVQTQKVTDMTQMNIKGPVKELWVTGASDSANVFQYSNLATRSTLELTGEQIVTEDVGTRTFLNIVEPFETHTSMPIRNVSVIPFEFDPESDIPNGTINFSRIRDQIFDGGGAETVWARTYNLFVIQGGIGNLMYN